MLLSGVSIARFVSLFNPPLSQGGHFSMPLKGHYSMLVDSVLCINTGEEIIIYHQGEEVGHFPYLPGTKDMVMLSERAIIHRDNHLSDTVRQWALSVARRQVQIYEEIIQRRSA